MSAFQFARVLPPPDGLALVTSVKLSDGGDYLDVIERYRGLFAPGPWVLIQLHDGECCAIFSFTVHPDTDGSNVWDITEGVSVGAVNVSRWPPKQVM